MENTMIEILSLIQKELKAPKGQKNDFGGYKYRSCEDILEAVKKVLPDNCSVILSDDIVQVGDRFYVKATAALLGGQNKIEVTAFARESFDKKGMDAAQITGAASSYARKYALNGLFCIDDTKDADATNDGKGGDKPEEKREFTREDKIFQRDYLYELSKKKTPEAVNAFINEWHDDLSAVPSFVSDVLKDAAQNRISGLKNKVSFPPPQFGFIDVPEATAFAILANDNLEKMDDEELYDWIVVNEHKLKALDKTLTAAKYNVGGTPYERFTKAYNLKTQKAAE